jgi:hypothetical protein
MRLTIYETGLYKDHAKETFKELNMILKKISVIAVLSIFVIAPTLHAGNGAPGGQGGHSVGAGGNGGHGGTSGGHGGNGGDSK